MKLVLVAILAACGHDGTEADVLGVGAQCTSTDECNSDIDLVCLPQFKGGYCGLQGCVSDADCPAASACVTDDGVTNFCFRICLDKSECNVNRSVDNESNCSSNITFVSGANGRKACVPPAGT